NALSKGRNRRSLLSLKRLPRTRTSHPRNNAFSSAAVFSGGAPGSAFFFCTHRLRCKKMPSSHRLVREDMRKRSQKRPHSEARASGESSLELLPVPGLPEFREGDDLADQVVDALSKSGVGLVDGDVVVIAQKIVSKVEGCIVQLASIKPSPRAVELAAKLKKDARLVEVILRESRRIVRSAPVLIV